MVKEEENVQFLELDLEIPDNSEELKHANDTLINIKNKFTYYQKAKIIDDESHEIMYEATMKVLDYVGRLSIPLNDYSKTIENAYIKQFPHAPALAKTMWLKHYENIHHEYNLIKNRCFRLLDEIDDEYMKQMKKVPPNWNP